MPVSNLSDASVQKRRTLVWCLYVVLPTNRKMVTMSIINPTVHMLGDNAACIAYTRFAQYLDKSVAYTFHSISFICRQIVHHQLYTVAQEDVSKNPGC